MATIAAKVPTQSGSKYVQQLCKHWSHKLETHFEGDVGTVTFPGAVTTMTVDSEGIAVAITGEDREGVERLTGVVANHLDRFAFREAPLTYDWTWRED
ncbi:DUF2218 domain-containing protein [Novosphingobium sp. Leaf2]|uniref:DUF2218 domain-containing protein n=1 Tax=Novosphingobium sp. Leaf2 TaxID=1735670 RepID=UPI0006FC40FD|nr:DUF2218 domain-containing protein [Novosphingobium sp. Leaf2]KQM13851.1 hypothetical protein ASE49_12455 [Novosphingobium sp. Leaf2]